MSEREWVALVRSRPTTAPMVDMNDVLAQFRAAAQDGRVVYGAGAAFAEIRVPVPPLSGNDYIVTANP